MKNILITGGTGLIGKWWLAAYKYVCEKIDIKANLYILSRAPDRFCQQHPELASIDINWITGDITTCKIEDTAFDYILHMATDVSQELIDEKPLDLFSSITQGTRQILDIAARSPRTKTLYVSSGGVYGKQSGSIKESCVPNIDILQASNSYNLGKIASEHLCSLYHKQEGGRISIARIFAVLGPHLSLTTHFAAGNFINNAINNRDIIIKSDGTVTRSYLYMTDVIRWLMAILLRGKDAEAYNVGSAHAVTLKELAEKIQQKATTNVSVQILGRPSHSSLRNTYLPNVDKIRNELGVEEEITFEEMIEATLRWNEKQIYC